MGAPGLAFETWENLDIRVSSLAGREAGWTTNLPTPRQRRLTRCIYS